MKYIIAIANSGGTGKTESCRKLGNEFIRQIPNLKPIFPVPIQIPTKYDFRLVMGVNSKIIGIESQGDPNTGLYQRLEDLINTYNCDLIYCTSRTRGKTVWAINDIARNFGYEVIWTSTYKNKTSFNNLNQFKALHLIDLAKQLGII